MFFRNISDIACVTKGKLYNVNTDGYVYKFVNNSKETEKNCCYVSIDGERHKGNEFASEAVENGASLILTERRTDEPFPCIEVSDVKKAICDLAEFYRQRELKKVAAITGSVGKTTVKELCASILGEKYGVLKTEGNKNNLLGLPLTVLSNTGNETAVLELGISEKGEMSRLSRIARPDIAVITNVGHMHAETLGSREEIANEKLKILESAVKDCPLVIPNDELLISLSGGENTVTVAIVDSTADYSAENIGYIESGSIFDLYKRGRRAYSGLFVPIIGEHGCFDAVLSIAVAEYFGCGEEQIRKGLSRYKTVGYRQNITDINGISVMCDCYNFGPESARAALSAFEEMARLKGIKKKILLLGSMLELGEISKNEHLKLGQEIAHSDFDVLITFGTDAEYIAEGAVSEGMDSGKVFSFTETEKETAGRAFRGFCSAPCAVLIKGSRAMKMEDFLSFVPRFS